MVALLAGVKAGLYHGHGHPVSSQSIVRHDARYHAPLIQTDAVPHYAGYYAAPAYYNGHDEYVRICYDIYSDKSKKTE